MIRSPEKTAVPLKISFCITCKGRLEQLQKTLPINIENNKDYPNTEFVVLDYGSEDGLGDWIREKFGKRIGKDIRYARVEPEDAPRFRMAHAKNMAHRLATGDVLCNLDADNTTAPGFAAWLNSEFSKNPDIFVRLHRLNHQLVKVKALQENVAERVRIKVHSVCHAICKDPPEALKEPLNLEGAEGRIAISAENFLRLHGYDEKKYNAWGGDDEDFRIRAREAGLELVNIPLKKFGNALVHSDELRVHLLENPEESAANVQSRHLQKTWKNKLKRIPRYTQEILNLDRRGILSEVANPDGDFGCGKVKLNFSDEETVLAPVPVQERAEERARHTGWSDDRPTAHTGTPSVR
jgi:glycosyltransferase involved in cell wall biosynthesis